MATLSPDTVERNGGYRIAVTGLVIPDGTYTVTVGVNVASAVDAYAGSYGNKNNVSVVGGAASFVTPTLVSGGPYSVYFDEVGGANTEAILAPSGAPPAGGGLLYVNKNHLSRTHEYRSLLLPWYARGPISVRDEPIQD